MLVPIWYYLFWLSESQLCQTTIDVYLDPHQYYSVHIRKNLITNKSAIYHCIKQSFHILHIKLRMLRHMSHGIKVYVMCHKPSLVIKVHVSQDNQVSQLKLLLISYFDSLIQICNISHK